MDHCMIAQQTLLSSNLTNKSWGDFIQFKNLLGHFRVISKNVSTLHPQSLDRVAISTKLSTMQASMFLVQEMNMA